MNIWQVYHHYYLQRPDIGIPHVKIGIISKKQWKVADFYKRKLDSNIGSCIITLTEPTTPLIFHAQPGGTFLFMGCFMWQEMKMNIHKNKMLWYNTRYCIRASYERRWNMGKDLKGYKNEISIVLYYKPDCEQANW